jgi:hypothetical protein
MRRQGEIWSKIAEGLMVADVNAPRIARLLEPDRIEFGRLIRKES